MSRKNGQAIVARNEFLQGMQEQVDNIQDIMGVVNALKNSLNVQAEVLGCHRYILEKFVPKELLEQAATEYSQKRSAEIAEEVRMATAGLPIPDASTKIN